MFGREATWRRKAYNEYKADVMMMLLHTVTQYCSTVHFLRK